MSTRQELDVVNQHPDSLIQTLTLLTLTPRTFKVRECKARLHFQRHLDILPLTRHLKNNVCLRDRKAQIMIVRRCPHYLGVIGLGLGLGLGLRLIAVESACRKLALRSLFTSIVSANFAAVVAGILVFLSLAVAELRTIERVLGPTEQKQ